jgi:hypothetical protein
MPFGNDTLYFASTSTGLYATNHMEGGETVWTQMGVNSIGNVVCEQVKTRAADSLIVVATHGNGIFTSKINSIDDVISVNEFTKELELNVYPNPTNSFISLSLVNDSPLRVFDVQGKQLLVLEDVNSKTKIDVSFLHAGTYFATTDLGTVQFFKN